MLAHSANCACIFLVDNDLVYWQSNFSLGVCVLLFLFLRYVCRVLYIDLLQKNLDIRTVGPTLVNSLSL